MNSIGRFYYVISVGEKTCTNGIPYTLKISILKAKHLKVVQYVPLLSVQEIILKYFIMIKYDYTNCNASQIMYLFINWSTSTRLPEKITTPHYKRTYYTSDHTPALFSKFDWNRMLYHYANLSIFRERNDPS